MLMDYLIRISIKTLKEDICGKFQRRLLRGTTEKNLDGYSADGCAAELIDQF